MLCVGAINGMLKYTDHVSFDNFKWLIAFIRKNYYNLLNKLKKN